MSRTSLLLTLCLSSCGATTPNEVHGSIGGVELQARSVLTFQRSRYATFGGVSNGTMGDPAFTDTFIAFYDVSGGCDLLETTRPSPPTATLWLDFYADGGPGPGSYATGPDQSVSGMFWPNGASECRFASSTSATGTLDQVHGNVTGSFSLQFSGDDRLEGTFDATPCGRPQMSDGCL